MLDESQVLSSSHAVNLNVYSASSHRTHLLTGCHLAGKS